MTDINACSSRHVLLQATVRRRQISLTFAVAATFLRARQLAAQYEGVRPVYARLALLLGQARTSVAAAHPNTAAAGCLETQQSRQDLIPAGKIAASLHFSLLRVVVQRAKSTPAWRGLVFLGTVSSSSLQKEMQLQQQLGFHLFEGRTGRGAAKSALARRGTLLQAFVSPQRKTLQQRQLGERCCF